VYHAGTATDADGRLVSAGGRVLAVTGRGHDGPAARAAAYAGVARISFDGAVFRSDIAVGPGPLVPGARPGSGGQS